MSDSISSYLENARLSAPRPVFRQGGRSVVSSWVSSGATLGAETVREDVTVTLSAQARQLAAEAFGLGLMEAETGGQVVAERLPGALASDKMEETPRAEETPSPGEKTETSEVDADEKKRASGVAGNVLELSAEELAEVKDLQARDKEVRAHEQAHKSAGGHYTGAAQFSFVVGPDGKRYAVGGEVPIDVSEIADDPQATIVKMQVVKRAAVAPAQPSAADRMVYSTASRIELNARAEMMAQRAAGIVESGESAQATEPETEESEGETVSADSSDFPARLEESGGGFQGVYA